MTAPGGGATIDDSTVLRRATTTTETLRRRVTAIGGLMMGLLLLGEPPTPVAAQATDLAPAGVLRASVVAANVSLATKDPATGEWSGIWIDLARYFGQRLGVPVVIVEYATEVERDAATVTGGWDIGSSGSTPEQAAALGRAAAIPYLDFDSTLAVGPNSAIRSIADMDRPGVRIGVLNGIAPELALSALVQHAEIVRVATSAEVAALLATGQVDAVAGNRTVVVGYASQVPGARVLADRYAVQQQRIVLAPGRSAASLAFASDVTRQALASGLIRASITRSGAVGVQPAIVAPGGLPRTGEPVRHLAGVAVVGLVAAAGLAGLLVRSRSRAAAGRRDR